MRPPDGPQTAVASIQPSCIAIEEYKHTRRIEVTVSRFESFDENGMNLEAYKRGNCLLTTFSTLDTV